MANTRVKKYVGDTCEFSEDVCTNKEGRITLHHGISCLIDERPQGQTFENIYTRVQRVEWTDEYENDLEGRPLRIVKLHCSPYE